MPGSWDPQVYWERAQKWRTEANQMSPGDTREAYIKIAEGYAKLADLIERDGKDRSISSLMASHEV
jgi:hypothetical protein